MRTLAERAARQGEFATDAPVRFPQLIIAPLLVALIWDGLFAKIDPLDVSRLLRRACARCSPASRGRTAS